MTKKKTYKDYVVEQQSTMIKNKKLEPNVVLVDEHQTIIESSILHPFIQTEPSLIPNPPVLSNTAPQSNIKYQLTEEEHKLFENVRILITENQETQKKLLNAVEKLTEKVEKLQETFKIEIPTPIVNVTMPKGNKEIIRDERGLIKKIIETDNDV